MFNSKSWNHIFRGFDIISLCFQQSWSIWGKCEQGRKTFCVNVRVCSPTYVFITLRCVRKDLVGSGSLASGGRCPPCWSVGCSTSTPCHGTPRPTDLPTLHPPSTPSCHKRIQVGNLSPLKSSEFNSHVIIRNVDFLIYIWERWACLQVTKGPHIVLKKTWVVWGLVFIVLVIFCIFFVYS